MSYKYCHEISLAIWALVSFKYLRPKASARLTIGSTGAAEAQFLWFQQCRSAARSTGSLGVSWFLMIAMRISSFVICFALLCIAGEWAQAQTEVCSLTTYFRDLASKEQVSSSRFLVGTFPLQLADDEVTKVFNHQESRANISVGVQMIKSSYSEKEPQRIRLLISFTGKPDDSYDLLEGAEAESIYDKHWKWLSVSNNISIGSRIYTFTFGCERQDKKRGR